MYTLKPKRFLWLLLLLFLLLGGGVLLRGGRSGRAAPSTVNPFLVSFSVTPAQIPSTGTATFHLVIEDPQGAANIRAYNFGLNPCTQSAGEWFDSNFERMNAQYFGVDHWVSVDPVVATRHDGVYGCTGGTYGLSPYAPWLGSSNVPGTATLVSVAKNFSGNQAAIDLTVQFANFPLGTYRTFYMLRDNDGHYQTDGTPEYWQIGTVQVIPAPTATHTPTGTLPPTATRTPTLTATSFPTLTPTPTPVPNNPPFLANLILSKNVAYAHDTVAFTGNFYDAQGGSTVDRAYLGVSPCAVNPGEAYNSNFERRLSTYFGTYVLLGGMNKYTARLSPNTNCTGGLNGLSPWSSVLSNSPGTASLTNVTKTVNGNQASVVWTMALNGFPAGTYHLYTMARDGGSLWTSGTTIAAWQLVSGQTLIVAPTPNPNIDYIHLGGQNANTVTIPQGSVLRVEIQASNLAPPGGEGQNAALYVSFPGQNASFLSQVQVGDGTSPDFTYTELPADPLYPAVQASVPTWTGGGTKTLAFDFAATEAGTFELLTNVVMPQGGTAYRAPLPETAGTEPDQHGNAAYLTTIVVEPGVSPLNRLNYYRSLAGVPPVNENLAWSQGCVNHATYMAQNGLLTHQEDPANPWYTPEGVAAGQAANLSGFSVTDLYQSWFTDLLMQAAFHALPMLNPRLTQAGYGNLIDGALPLPAAGCLDVWRGIDYGQPGTYPVRWPATNGLTPLVEYGGGEQPDPLTSCPGYTVPSGLPVLLLLGNDVSTPVVTASSFTGNGQALAHCVFSETTYTNPDPSQQQQGRSTLDFFDGVVLMPREPLQLGTTYTVSLTVSGEAYTWSFQVAPGVVVLPEGEVR